MLFLFAFSFMLAQEPTAPPGDEQTQAEGLPAEPAPSADEATTPPVSEFAPVFLGHMQARQGEMGFRLRWLPYFFIATALLTAATMLVNDLKARKRRRGYPPNTLSLN